MDITSDVNNTFFQDQAQDFSRSMKCFDVLMPPTD